MQQRVRFGNVGGERSRAYSKGGVEWLRFESGVDRDGHTVWQGSPGSFQRLGYDRAGRLTNVADTVAGVCTTRSYRFSRNGNRSQLTTGGPGAGGACESASTSTVTGAFDGVDRKVDAGYSYDRFGRTLTLPASDVGGGAGLSVGYHVNDMVASLTQGSGPGARSKVFTLDPVMRVRTAVDTTVTSGGGTVESRRVVNHYGDAGDRPSWIATSTNAGATWGWQRNVAGIDGGLVALQDQSGTPKLQIVNPHGDVVATVEDTTSVSGINAYHKYTEYGAPRAGNPSSSPARYG